MRKCSSFLNYRGYHSDIKYEKLIVRIIVPKRRRSRLVALRSGTTDRMQTLRFRNYYLND